MRLRTAIPTTLALGLALVSGAALSQQVDTDELIARERVRSAVDSIFAAYYQPAAGGEARTEIAIATAQALVASSMRTSPGFNVVNNGA